MGSDLKAGTLNETAIFGGIESHLVNHHLFIWSPIGKVENMVVFDFEALPFQVKSTERDRDHGGDFPMLIGIGEAIDQKEGVVARVWLTSVRLKLFDQPHPKGNTVEISAGYGHFKSVGDLASVVSLLDVGGESALDVGISLAGIGQGCHQIVECTPEVVHDVPYEDAESWFLRVRDQSHITPAGLWIDLRKSDRIRTVLFEFGRKLSIQRVQMVKSSVHLGATRAEVQSERHDLTLEGDAQEQRPQADTRDSAQGRATSGDTDSDAGRGLS
jgi:hypothetical protein